MDGLLGFMETWVLASLQCRVSSSRVNCPRRALTRGGGVGGGGVGQLPHDVYRMTIHNQNSLLIIGRLKQSVYNSKQKKSVTKDM